MLNSLHKYVNTILKSLHIQCDAFVYDIASEIPEWCQSICITHQFLIVLPDSSDYAERVERFIGQRVFVFDTNLYWFAGEKLLTPIKAKKSESAAPKRDVRSSLNCVTRLPDWLDVFLFRDLQAEWNPDFQKFDHNLYRSHDENKTYLGTYFPRTYADVFCIFENLFKNKIYKATIKKRTSIDILSVGCGTGGDIIGLLTVIDKYCGHSTIINITAIDGNADALEFARRIIVKYQEVNNRTLSCDFRHKTIQDFSVEQFNELEGNSYDFIMSSKMVCEVIAAGNGTTDNSYYDFVKTFFPFLKFEGVCLLLDVTTRCPHLDSYYPMMLGRQINRAIQENDRMALVVPRSCAIYGKECSIETCFHQKEFTISHSGVRSDKCRVAYRILGHRPFVQNIIKFDNSSKLSVSCDRFCKFTEHFETTDDAYYV